MQPQFDNSTHLEKNLRYDTTLLPDGNWLFFDADNNEIVVTTASAGILWELCSGDLSVGEIVDAMSKMYPSEGTQKIKDDVFAVVPQLLQKELLTII